MTRCARRIANPGAAEAKRCVVARSHDPRAIALPPKSREDVDAIGEKKAEESGNTILTISAEETARWKEAADPIVAEWIAEMNDKGLDGQALVDAARSLVDSNTAK